jgi:hypothetical protein
MPDPKEQAMTIPRSVNLADLDDLAAQACELRERYPALYAFLTTRESALERARAAIPPRGDIEALVGFNAEEHLRRHLLNLPPGVCDLVRAAERREQLMGGRAR